MFVVVLVILLQKHSCAFPSFSTDALFSATAVSTPPASQTCNQSTGAGIISVFAQGFFLNEFSFQCSIDSSYSSIPHRRHQLRHCLPVPVPHICRAAGRKKAASYPSPPPPCCPRSNTHTQFFLFSSHSHPSDVQALLATTHPVLSH